MGLAQIEAFYATIAQHDEVFMEMNKARHQASGQVQWLARKVSS